MFDKDWIIYSNLINHSRLNSEKNWGGGMYDQLLERKYPLWYWIRYVHELWTFWGKCLRAQFKFATKSCTNFVFHVLWEVCAKLRRSNLRPAYLVDSFSRSTCWFSFLCWLYMYVTMWALVGCMRRMRLFLTLWQVWYLRVIQFIHMLISLSKWILKATSSSNCSKTYFCHAWVISAIHLGCAPPFARDNVLLE